MTSLQGPAQSPRGGSRGTAVAHCPGHSCSHKQSKGRCDQTCPGASGPDKGSEKTCPAGMDGSGLHQNLHHVVQLAQV